MMIANVLIPLDGSSLAERALPYAAGLAGAAKARLRLVHVETDLPSAFHPRADVAVLARLEHLAHQLRAQDIQATASALTGHPLAETILAAAGAPPADLIVMSTHGHTGLAAALLGSVAYDILRRTHTPALAVPVRS